jgi:hypothetical protein
MAQQTQETFLIKYFVEKFRLLTKNSQNLFSFFSILVAIGAYSKDSVIIDLITQKKTYSVVRSTSMGGTESTGFLRLYPTSFGNKLAPIQMLVYLSIRNNSEYEQIIQGVKVEIKSGTSWRPVRCLSKGSGIFTAFNGIEKASLEDFNENDLIVNLGNSTIKSNNIVQGWLFLEFEKEFRSQNVLQSEFKITLFSGFGESEPYLIKNIDIGDNSVGTRSAEMKSTQIIQNLSNIEILPEGDLYERFEFNRLKEKNNK